MRARWRGASRLAAGVLIATLGAACSPSGDAATTTTGQTGAPTTSPPTSTTLPSVLPGSGTIPLAELADVQRADDIVGTAERALRAWSDVPAECSPSRAEALATRDQFIRVATYLERARGAVRDLRDTAAFKRLIDLEASYRTYAATRTFIVCGESTGIAANSPATSTTIVGGTAAGLTAGGIAEVDLTIDGDPKVDQEFTVADLGAPCDGIGANTTFLVSAQDSSGRWVIVDVIVDKTGLTSAAVIPTRAGPGAIEYLAYCGTLDKRHGVTTFRVRPTGDTTTTSPTPTTITGDAPLVVIEIPTTSGSVLVDPRATEVAVEPKSVTAFLAANDAVGGVVIARLNLGDWIALRENEVTWIPAGPGDEGLETRIVGARNAVERTVEVVAPSTTTTTSTALAVSSSSSAVTVAESTPNDEDDATLWVIVVLVTVAALTVLFSRLRLRR